MQIKKSFGNIFGHFEKIQFKRVTIVFFCAIEYGPVHFNTLELGVKQI